MRGFIKITRAQTPTLVSLNAIATINDSSGQARITLLVRDSKGNAEIFYADQTYEAVIKAVEEATR